jgi:hypothetical protein
VEKQAPIRPEFLFGGFEVTGAHEWRQRPLARC